MQAITMKLKLKTKLKIRRGKASWGTSRQAGRV
jgi:hypothetical protein